jgi:hypothetical protein
MKQNRAMTEPVDALRQPGLGRELSCPGRRAKLEGDRFGLFVVEVAHGGYYSWCDDPAARTAQFHETPIAAMQARIQRAAGRADADNV